MNNNEKRIMYVAEQLWNIKEQSIPGLVYWKHIPYILALNKLGLRQGLICEWLNEVEKDEYRMSHQQLNAYITQWHKLGLLNVDEKIVNGICADIKQKMERMR